MREDLLGVYCWHISTRSIFFIPFLLMYLVFRSVICYVNCNVKVSIYIFCSNISTLGRITSISLT